MYISCLIQDMDIRNLLLYVGWSYKNLLHKKGISFVDKLIQQLLQGVGCKLSNKERIIMMRFQKKRVLSKWMASVRYKAAKEAEELCVSGQYAEALVLLQRAIDWGDLPSRAFKAWMLTQGREGVARDYNGAF